MATRAFKGEIKDARDLLRYEVAHFFDRGYNTAIPEFAVIDQIFYPKSKEVGVQYFDHKNDLEYVTISGETKVRVLVGTKGQGIRAKFDQWHNTQAPRKEYFTSGSDPEIFVEDENGEVIPSWTFLGSKEKPSIGPNIIYGRNKIYSDGFQAEFTVGQSDCLAWVVDSIQRGLAGTLLEAKKLNPKARLSNKTVVPVKHSVLKVAAEEHVQFGCMPSMNVYGLSGKKEDGRTTPFRFAGGHIHLGISGGTPTDPRIVQRMIMAMDSIVGVACVSLFAEHDSPIRREYYGLAGEYRTPKHGIEYRVLSNAWLMHPLVTNLVFDLARYAAAYGMQNRTSWKASEQDTIDAIQNCDVDLARSILSKNKNILTTIMSAAYFGNNGAIAASLFNAGVEKFIKDPQDISGNWQLENYKNWPTHCEGLNKNWKSASYVIAAGKKV